MSAAPTVLCLRLGALFGVWAALALSSVALAQTAPHPAPAPAAAAEPGTLAGPAHGPRLQRIPRPGSSAGSPDAAPMPPHGPQPGATGPFPPGFPKATGPRGPHEPGAPIGPHGAAEGGEPGSGHEGACPGHGPTDRPPVVNLVQGWLGVWNQHAVPPPDGARIGGLQWWLWHLTPYPFRYDNPKDECDPRNQPTPLVAPVLNFAVLGFFVWRFGRKPLREALKKRAAAIRGQIDHAKEQKHKARARLAEYRGELDHLDDTLVALRQRYAEEAEREQQELLRQAEQARDRLLSDAAFRVEQEARAARDVLSRQAMEQALGAAEALLRTAISAQDRDRLGEQYLASLRAALRADGLGPRQGMTP